jgi:hypothetical protein
MRLTYIDQLKEMNLTLEEAQLLLPRCDRAKIQECRESVKGRRKACEMTSSILPMGVLFSYVFGDIRDVCVA